MHANAPRKTKRDFPEDFVWGAATCAAFCEGETVSDWAKTTAPDGSVPDDGPRHWRRYRFDFRIMANLGVSAYRFGMDWGRLQRAPYEPLNRENSLRYLEMLAELRSLGIEPWATLFQNALPRWAADAGGWLNPETPAWFADFALKLATLTDGEVANWITVHEPHVYALANHAWGLRAGGSRGGLGKARLALSRLAQGHRLAAETLRKRLPVARIGLSLPGGAFLPRRAWHPGDWLAATAADWLLNRYSLPGFLSGGGKCDFIMLGTGNEVGVGMTDTLSLSSIVSPSLPARMRHKADGASASARRGRLRRLIRSLGVPIYLAGRAANNSPDSLAELLGAYAETEQKERAAGFFYDPLLDQFDPLMGLTSGGGLMKVDFHGQERRRDLRKFARSYGEVARSGILRKG